MDEEAEDEAIAEVTGAGDDEIEVVGVTDEMDVEAEEVEVTCAEDDDTEVSEMEEEEEVDLRLW